MSAAGDGLRANNDEDAEKGTITITGGTVNVTAGEDAVQAETTLRVEGGNLTLDSGGGSANSSQESGWGNPAHGANVDEGEDTVSMKGLKAGSDVTIAGGIIAIDSADDAVHSNGSITVSGGAITAASGDDGLHADATLTISGGEIDAHPVVTRAFEQAAPSSRSGPARSTWRPATTAST